MVNTKDITSVLASIAALEPDIAIALTAYNVLHGIWLATNPTKTEEEYRAYLQSSSLVNVETTAAYLRAHGYVETPEGSGNWAKAVAV